MIKHVIGDVHLDKRLYEQVPQWRGKVSGYIKDAFEAVLSVDCDVRLFAGDFFNHYSVSEEMVKYAINRLSAEPNVQNIILGGNHDSTKVYARTSSLDILAELPNVTVINSFAPVRLTLDDGTTVLGIPHMKSQEAFEDACASSPAADIVLLHCTYGDRPPYIQSTNDLYLSPEMADAMAERHGYVFFGHVHKHRQILENLVQLGSIIPQGPRELGLHCTYLLADGKDTTIELHHQPKWQRTTYVYKGVTEFLKWLHSLDAAVNFVYVKDIDRDRIKAAKIAYDAFIEGSDKIILCYFDEEEEASGIADIKYYDMSFNVRTELNLFAEESKMKSDQYLRLDGYLNDALTAEEMEEDDD